MFICQTIFRAKRKIHTLSSQTAFKMYRITGQANTKQKTSQIQETWGELIDTKLDQAVIRSYTWIKILQVQVQNNINKKRFKSQISKNKWQRGEENFNKKKEHIQVIFAFIKHNKVIQKLLTSWVTLTWDGCRTTPRVVAEWSVVSIFSDFELGL